jgi:integrase
MAEQQQQPEAKQEQSEVKRERGRGSIYQRPGISGFWWMRFYKNGRQYRMSTQETDERKALRVLNAKLKERDGELVGGKKMVTPAQSRITVNELLTALELDYKLRGKSGARLLSNLKPLQEHFGPARANQLTSADVDRFIESALQHGRRKFENGKPGKPSRPASINRSLQLLGQAYKLAIRTGRLSAAPYIRRLSEVGNVRQGFFSTMEFRSVVANLPAYLRDFALFAWLVAWRPKEIRSLSWLDLDGDTIRLRAENAKIRKARNIPLVGELAEVIDRQRLKMSPLTNLIFHNEGAPIGDFRKSWRTACKLADVPEKLFYDLRRSGVRDMIRSGTSQTVAMSISGHLTSSMFQRYNITDDRDQRTALLDRQNYSAAEKERAERGVTPSTEVVQ